MAKKKEKLMEEVENQDIAEYAKANGVPEAEVAKFLDIAGSYGFLKDEDKEMLAKLVKSFMEGEDKEVAEPAKKSSRKASDEDVLVTAEGLRDLKIKHYILVNWKRNECAEQIKIARGFGDLSENAEYDAAKEAQGKIEAEIAQIENNLGFFSSGSDSIVQEFNKKIQKIKNEISVLKEKKKAIDIAERELKGTGNE